MRRAPASLANRRLDYDGSMVNVASASFTPVDDDLYREIILDHYRRPRHRERVSPADRTVEADNPLCGDEIDLTLRFDADGIAAIGFEGRGCSISQASASMLCDAVDGMDAAKARELANRFRSMIQGGDEPEDLGDLEALRGVRDYPARVKCATLAWNALLEALGSGEEFGNE
ncbi:MAG: Fe-S cluster assembly sulfur transfer protein SufU [Candidatus Dormibacteria bacterium]